MQVMNRSEADLKKNVTAEGMQDKEAAFFDSHAELSRLPDSCKGLPALVQQLVYLQKTCIRKFLPGFKQQVGSCMQWSGVRSHTVDMLSSMQCNKRACLRPCMHEPIAIREMTDYADIGKLRMCSCCMQYASAACCPERLLHTQRQAYRYRG